MKALGTVTHKSKPITNVTMTLVYGLVLFMALISTPSTSFGQIWKKGQDSLLKNDVKNAQIQLNAAIKGATRSGRPKTEIAETYKYLGVAQFMGGNKPAATQSFKMAKSMNPALRLTDGEVVDETVIPFFQAATASSARPSAAQTNNIGRGSMQGMPGVVKKQSKRTLLKVISNVPNARITLEGIAYGSAGQDIEIDPGVKVLEVEATGYKTKAIKVKVDPLTSSTVTVNLEKILPKPKPLAAPKNLPLPSAKLPNEATKEAKNKMARDELFGADPEIPIADTPSFASQPQQIPQQVIPPAAPQQPVTPGYGLAQPYPNQPMYGQPPAYQQPYAQQPYAPQPVYQPPYAQPYAQPYPSQPQVYGAYPQPSPYGGYQAPQMTPNPYQPYAPAQPTSPPPPSMSGPVPDPYGGYLGPPPEDASMPASPAVDVGGGGSHSGSGGGMPPPPILPSDSSKPSKGKSSKGDSEKCGTLIKLMPFGVGQFCQGSPVKGIFFLGAQAASLYFYKVNSDRAAVIQSKLNQTLAERTQERDSLSGDQLQAYDAETDTYEQQSKTSINKANSNAQLSLLAFGGAWGLGVIDAFFNAPSAKSKKSKSKRPRLMQSYHLDLDKAPFGSVALAQPLIFDPKTNGSYLEYMTGYAPALNPSGQMNHSFWMGISWEL